MPQPRRAHLGLVARPAVRGGDAYSEERESDARAPAEIEARRLHAQRLETIGQLTGGIAHDFNNLLTVINGYCERLIATMDGDGQARGDLERIHKAGQRAAELTRQLLAFSRRSAAPPVPLDLNEVVGEVTGMLMRVLGESITVRTSLAPDLGAILADPAQVEQVIMNLAINARDAMPGGGTLTVETCPVTLADGAPPVAGLRPGPYAVLTVSDTGLGIEPATVSRIFEPFFTTKAADKGTGLGLSTVHGIVTQLGGHITVESTPGRGTTMRVFLPGVRARPAAEILPMPEPESPGTGTVLVVEDEDGVRELIREFLESAGYRVLDARCGEDALAVAESSGGAIDLLVADRALPGLSGSQTASRLRSAIPGLAVLFVSGYPDEMAHDEASASTFLAKPFTRNALANKVREVVRARPAAVVVPLA